MLIDLTVYETYQDLFELGAAGMDQLALEHIDGKLLVEEAELMTKKWFDYREFHPVEASFLFCELYKEIYPQVLHRRVDYQSAPFMTGIKKQPFYFQSPKTMTGIWKARQTADRLCIQYPFFIREMLLLTERRGRAHLARPEQMYQPELLELVKEKWSEHLKTSIVHSKHEYFRAENFRCEELQIAHAQFLIAQVVCRSNKDLVLHSLIERKRILPLFVARQHFEPHIIDKARSIDI